MQTNWIGRSKGAEVEFAVEGLRGESVRIFTTRPDTLFGATFMVLAPEHPLVERITTDEASGAGPRVRREGAQGDRDRAAVDRAREDGRLTGGFAINPVNGERIPIWVADYVLMATAPARSWPCRRTTSATSSSRTTYRPADPRGDRAAGGAQGELREAYTGAGVMVNSGEFDGLRRRRGHRAVTAWLEAQGKGKPAVKYRLRDWLISRQRYWGAPIPVVYCPIDGIVPVPAEQLPVLLPKEYRPLRRHTRVLAHDVSEVRRRGAARDGHDGHVHRFVLVLPALREPARRDAAVRPGAGQPLDAGRPVHRRRRARDPAPALLALLHQGAARRRAARRVGAVHAPVHPGDGQARRPGDVEVAGQRRVAGRAGGGAGRRRGAHLRDVHRPARGGRRVDGRRAERRGAVLAARVAVGARAGIDRRRRPRRSRWRGRRRCCGARSRRRSGRSPSTTTSCASTRRSRR